VLAIGKDGYFPRTWFRVSPSLRWLSTDWHAKQQQEQLALGFVPSRSAGDHGFIEPIKCPSCCQVASA